MEATKRKGARSIKDIPDWVLRQLNLGEIESSNLVEWLAVDQKLLLQNILQAYGKQSFFPFILDEINGLKKQTITSLNEAIGLGLLKQIELNNSFELIEKIANHISDAPRCWATYMVGRNEKLSLNDRFLKIMKFASDKHFGVREIAWMAMRPSISEHLEKSLLILEKWVRHSDENIRRFASEATRPRGVWCSHIELLKQQPQLALTILESLKSDTSRYVQDSVGNWLNDASKTQPQFVIDLCDKWVNNSNTKETNYIIKKALRTITK